MERRAEAALSLSLVEMLKTAAASGIVRSHYATRWLGHVCIRPVCRIHHVRRYRCDDGACYNLWRTAIVFDKYE